MFSFTRWENMSLALQTFGEAEKCFVKKPKPGLLSETQSRLFSDKWYSNQKHVLILQKLARSLKKIYKHTQQHNIKIISCQHKGNGTVSNQAERERERVRERARKRERDVVLGGWSCGDYSEV